MKTTVYYNPGFIVIVPAIGSISHDNIIHPEVIAGMSERGNNTKNRSDGL